MTDAAREQRPRFVPASTYRLQVHAGFPFDAAQAIVPYLQRLGVGAAYTSPYFTAQPGSTHGYDVSNHNELNPELGGADGHTAFTDALRAAGMQHIVDFVPNHMGIATTTNRWWRDVLENGPDSYAGRFFDIDWFPIKRELRRKLLLPILGDQYGQVLERGELQLEFRDGLLQLRYFDHELPLNPRHMPRVYRTGLTKLTEDLGAANPQLAELLSIVAALQTWSPRTPEGPLASQADRESESERLRERLRRLTAESPRILRHIEDAVREFNGVPGRPESFDKLHELLEEQAYRLAYWRTASQEINYRRFFDINGLAGLRVEDPEVFGAIHQLLFRLIRDVRVTGVRIDHSDGLFDPARYFEMLQELAEQAWEVPHHAGARTMYLVTEKILSGRERLPRAWPVHGTTGYNFLNQVNGLFINTANARRMRRVYTKLTGASLTFDDLLYECKRLIMDTSMASELNVLAHMLNRISESNRRSRDFTLNSLHDVIVEVVACFPAYRTYITESGWVPEDRAVVEQAIVRARRRNPATDPTIFDFFREVVLPRDPTDVPATGTPERREGYPPADASEAAGRLRFAMKFQQYTGPLQAKGLEDTAFYRYNLLISLNEVGGDPSTFGRTVHDFHHANTARRHDWPYEMLATATHDTKLGEDVRARIDVLSEMPDEWGREVARWMRLNRDHRTILEGEPAPDRNDEYRFYQALTGIWPPDLAEPAAPPELVERLQNYMIKAVKEAKLHSSWINPNDDYERAVTTFVERTLCGTGGARFVSAFLPLQQRVARAGLLNSFAQLLLKIASPGVPDFYQGTELWDLSLVDPDNRRPVDYDRRAAALEEAAAVLDGPIESRAEGVRRLLDRWTDGTIKMFIAAAALRLRRSMPELFLDGDYLPLETECTVPGRVVAFARALADGRVALAVAPHLATPLIDAERSLPVGDRWKTSRVLLPEALAAVTYRDAFTGAERRATTSSTQSWLFVGEIFDVLPVALLVGDGRPDS
jgi:(1->4)-alpha-D-glucan 1-alpha-D-glucosylmutase